MSLGVVLGRSSPCNVPRGYASVAELPAALPVERCASAHRGGRVRTDAILSILIQATLAKVKSESWRARVSVNSAR